MIDKAAIKFGEFLEALGCDWKNDPNSMETPKRVAKAYVNDLWAGRYNAFPEITTFPNHEYDGIIFEGNIPVFLCVRTIIKPSWAKRTLPTYHK